MARSHVLLVSENPLEMLQSLDISIFEKKHLIWWRDPRNVLRGCLLHMEEHNLQLFTNAPVNGWGTHWYLVLYNSKCVGIFSIHILDSSSLLNNKLLHMLHSLLVFSIYCFSTHFYVISQFMKIKISFLVFFSKRISNISYTCHKYSEAELCCTWAIMQNRKCLGHNLLNILHFST